MPLGISELDRSSRGCRRLCQVRDSPRDDLVSIPYLDLVFGGMLNGGRTDIDYMNQYRDFSVDPNAFSYEEGKKFLAGLHANGQHVTHPSVTLLSLADTPRSMFPLSTLPYIFQTPTMILMRMS